MKDRVSTFDIHYRGEIATLRSQQAPQPHNFYFVGA